MRVKLANLTLLTALGLLAASQANAQAPIEYAFTPLYGTQPTVTHHTPIVTARSINDVGQVLGHDNVDFGNSIIWNGTKPTVIASFRSKANGFNNAGEWVGSDIVFGPPSAVLNGRLIAEEGSRAYAINDAGEVAGTSSGRATVWNPSPTTGPGTAGQAGGGYNTPLIWLDTAEGHSSEALAINNRGQVAGHYFATSGNQISHATVWNGTEAVVLDALGGWSSWANAINDSGQVAGTAQVDGPSNLHHAALWDGTTPIDLGTLGGERSEAYGINNAGQVVGRSDLADGSSHAALWNGTSAIDLNTLLDDKAISEGWVLTHAYDINNNGWIVGDAHNSQETVGFLLAPIPEPEIYAMLLAGLGLLGLRRRKSRMEK